jgi:preprotein translocase subunit SecE
MDYMLNKLKPFKFFDQVKQEAKKVVWPEKKELIASASIVVVAVLLFSLASLILDYGIHNLMSFLLNIGK